MKTTNKNSELTNKILKGLDLAYEKLIAEKRAKKQSVVVMRNNKIEYIQL